MTDISPLRLAVIIASVRDTRLGPAVSEWVLAQTAARPELDVNLIDLLDHPLPLVLPAPGRSPEPEVAAIRDRLSRQLAEADAFVIVTPEYNHSFPASLKNVLDWFLSEWAGKPVGFVSYGGHAGGLRAVEQLRLVFAELHTVTVRETVSFHHAWQQFPVGATVTDAGAAAAAKTLFDQLVWWARPLRAARAEHPYG
ncbi:NAD(P)H-dependent oxidoreductase [Micromonospora sp. NPDC049101]|uniref:NADPH-dependent FMN reductase n=1 Tax=unclassified Micromonospora TaxID=2617518 RepID=UPI0033F29D97